jgi:hypothetical protein
MWHVSWHNHAEHSTADKVTGHSYSLQAGKQQTLWNDLS